MEPQELAQIPPVVDVGDVVATWIGGAPETTRRAYLADVRLFAAWAKVSPPAAALEQLVDAGPGRATGVAIGWSARLLEDGRAPATVNRRLATLRSFLKHARLRGRITWSVEIPGVRSRSYRDTTGPEWATYTKALRGAGPRDLAIARLMGDRGLRRGEVVALDLEDVADGCLALLVRGKGRRGERERMTIAEPTAVALRAWISERGQAAGPLFPGRGRGGRLSGKAVWDISWRVLGCRPHGLRHTAITKALDATHGDLRAVQKFARHARPETTTRYDDARQDLAGEVARRVFEPAPRRRRSGA